MRASLIKAEALLHGQRRRLTAGAGLVVGAALAFSGIGQGFDDTLRAWRDGIRSRDASGEIVMIEIDARSIAKIDRWPWPRRHHAAAVDALRADGADTIAFDVDFSSPSNPAEDGALGAALERAGGTVILPTFRQYAGVGERETIDSLPAPGLREHALLAAVTVAPDRDGMIRSVPLGAVTSDTARPSLAAMVAGLNSFADQVFPIDYSIEPSTIPHYSFTDLIEGRIPRGSFTGKRAIIGATAIELGDRYAIPRHGVVPGVVVQALAAETLLDGAPPVRYGPVPALLVALLAIAGIALKGSRILRSAGFAAALAFLIAGPLISEAFGISMGLAPAFAAMAITALVAAALAVMHSFARRVLRNVDTELPNLTALEMDWADKPGAGVALARIANYAKLASGLGQAGTAELIRKLAERLAMVSEGGALYRTDECSLVWVLGAEDAEALDGRFATAAALMRVPVQCAGKPVDVTLHYGVADHLGEGAAVQLVADAALAAAQAAEKGSRWERFVAGGEDETSWRLSLLGELDRAIETGDLWVAYQPKLDLAAGAITGAEALVRWRHPSRGNIAPDHFIPLVEESGRVGKLTEFVLTRALSDFAKLDPGLTVSVNIAANLLGDRDIVTMVEHALIRTGSAPGRLVLEVTESAAMTDPEAAIATLEALTRMGVKLSIDDYGTGQSTLSYLKRLPASELKIDKCFVQQLVENRSDEILVGSTIHMAHELGLRVVVEGVEDAACLERLRGLGCDLIQGYFVGKPTPIADFITLIETPARKAA